MKALKEGNKTITITCKCGSNDFYRDEYEATICKTYLEGYFNCCNLGIKSSFTQKFYQIRKLIISNLLRELKDENGFDQDN